jgi:osmotically-inducible protein OsmY
MLTVTAHKTYKIFSLCLLFAFLHGCAAVVAGTAATSAVVAQDRRTAGTIVEDKSIQLKATQAIKDVAQDNPAVSVVAISYNGRVLLVGQAPSKKVRVDIEKEVRTIEKVKHVHNEITLSSPISGMTRSSDSWITTKIKSEMALTKEFNPTRVKVITEDGVVYLMGIVKEDEEYIAVDIARHVKGVKKVVKIFEYERS